MKNTIIFLVTLLIFVLSCARQAKKEKPVPPEKKVPTEVVAENYVGDGIDYYQEEKFGKAAKRWEKALELIPNDAEVHNFLGMAYHKAGHLDSAITSFKHAVELDTLYHQAWNNLGFMYFLKSDYKTALKYFNRSLEANPSYNQARLNRQKTQDLMEGNLKMKAFELVEKTAELDSLELKIKNYRHALEIDSNYVDAWNNLGVSYYYYGNLDSAVYCLRRALDINPDYPPAHNNVGYMLDAMGEYDKAIAHYQKAIRLRPFYLAAMANLVDSYVHKKDYASAREILNALKIGNPDHYLVQERIDDYQDILYNTSSEGGNKE